MNMPTDMIWNAILTVGLGLVGGILRYAFAEMQRLQILLNRTREELAKEYVTKAEVHADINRVIIRIDNLDAKIERLLERLIK
jgi:hypothetical protein